MWYTCRIRNEISNQTNFDSEQSFVKKEGALDTNFAGTVDSKNSILKQHVV